MDLEEMKSQWAGLNQGINNTETTINNQKLDNMKTAQQQLVSRYRAFAGLAATFACLSSVLFSRLTDNVWLELGFTLFFAVCAVMDFILQRNVGEIDLGTMTVTEVAQKAASCRRLHHIFQIILIPTVIVLLAFMAYTMTDNKDLIYGMGIGAAIGIVIGLKAYFKFMDNYKSLTKQ